MGELTLSGEVRPVAGLDRRLTEGRRFGFTRFLVPRGSEGLADGSGVSAIRTLPEALRVLPGGGEMRQRANARPAGNPRAGDDGDDDR